MGSSVADLSVPRPSYLTGQLLLAMPGIGDPRFSRAVILVCAHDDKGAMGLVLSQPVPGLSLSTLLEQLDIKDPAPSTQSVAVMNGGPVESARGFVLHPADYRQKDTVIVNEHFAVTGTVDVLHAVAQGDGPEKLLFMLGYAGWQAGQLEHELQENTWLTLPADPHLIFEIPSEEKWDAATRQLGIKPLQLTGAAGRA